MKKLRGIIFLLLFISFVLVVGFFIITKTELFQTSKITSKSSIIYEKIVELSELTTLKYEYKNVIISRKEQNIPLTDFNYAETIKLIKYTGYLKAGTDLSKIQISYDELSENLLVRVPKSQILDNVADIANAEVEDVKGNIFSDYPSQTIFNEIKAETIKLEKEKIRQGLLEEADKRTQQLLKSFLSANEYKDTIIEFY